MATVGGGQTVRTLEAEAAFAAGLALIKGAGATQVKLPTGANVPIVGISGLPGDPAGTGLDAQKQKPPVITQGEADVTAGGAFAVGDLLRVAGATGKLVKVGGEAVGALVNVVGRAMQAAAADGDIAAAMIGQYQFVDQVKAATLVAGTAAATAANYGSFFIADAAMELIEAVERHETAGSDGGAVTLMVTKVPSGTAKGAGTDMLAAGVDLKAVADTNITGTLHGTQANLQLAAGDAVALVTTGTLTAVAGVSVRCTFRLL